MSFSARNTTGLLRHAFRRRSDVEECIQYARSNRLCQPRNVNEQRRFSSASSPSSDRLHRHRRYHWKNIAERSIQFIEKMENQTIHQGVLKQNIYSLLADCANCPVEPETDMKDLGPIASKLLELAFAGASIDEVESKSVESKLPIGHRNVEYHSDAAAKAELYDLAIKTWMRSKHPDSLEEAEKLLWTVLLDDHIINSNDKSISNITNNAFAQVLHAHSNLLEQNTAFTDDDINQTQKLIDTMQQHWDNPNTVHTPNTTAMNGILNVLCKSSLPSNALSLLKSMADRQDQGETDLAPNNISYGIVISSLAKTGDVDSAKSVIDWMTSRHATNNSYPKPTTVEYTSLLDAWANSGHPDAGGQAEKLLLWMMEQDDNDVRPNARSFSVVINAWAKMKNDQAAERAEKILRHMIYLQEKGVNMDVETTLISLSTVVDAWARSSHPQSTVRATAIADYMERLDHPGLVPTERTYTALIKAWAEKATKESGVRAVQIWRRMEERGVKPTTRTFNNLLHALLQSGPSGASEAFDRFLQADSEQQSWALDTVSFNTALNALTKCTRAEAVDLADSLLARMIQYEESGPRNGNHIQPNTVTFNSFMTLLLKQATQEYDPAEEIQNLLDELEESSSTRPLRQPNATTYALCIRAWALSSNEKKLRYARDILNRCEGAFERGNVSAKPTTATYNGVIYACRFPVITANTTGTMAAELAIETFNRLRQLEYAEPDEMTYTNLLQVLARNLTPGTKRETLIEEVFLSCCQDGLVSNAVLRELRYASTFVYDKSVSFHLSTTKAQGEVASLPKEWQRNVKVTNTKTNSRATP